MLLKQGRLLQFFSVKHSEVCYFHSVWSFALELGLLHDVTELLFFDNMIGFFYSIMFRRKLFVVEFVVEPLVS